MKYLLLLVAAALFVSYQLKFSSNKNLIICFEGNSKPYSYIEQRTPKGFDVDIAKALATQMGVELSIKWLNQFAIKPEAFEKDRELLLTGQCDAIAGHPMHEQTLGLGPEARRNSLPASSKGSRLISSVPYSVRAHSIESSKYMTSSEVNVGFVVLEKNYPLLKNINIALHNLFRNRALEQIASRYNLSNIPTNYPPVAR